MHCDSEPSVYKSASCQLVFSSLDSGQAETCSYRVEQENSHSCLALHLVLFRLKRKANVPVRRVPLGKKTKKQTTHDILCTVANNLAVTKL